PWRAERGTAAESTTASRPACRPAPRESSQMDELRSAQLCLGFVSKCDRPAHVQVCTTARGRFAPATPSVRTGIMAEMIYGVERDGRAGACPSGARANDASGTLFAEECRQTITRSAEARDLQCSRVRMLRRTTRCNSSLEYSSAGIESFGGPRTMSTRR